MSDMTKSGKEIEHIQLRYPDSFAPSRGTISLHEDIMMKMKMNGKKIFSE